MMATEWLTMADGNRSTPPPPIHRFPSPSSRSSSFLPLLLLVAVAMTMLSCTTTTNSMVAGGIQRSAVQRSARGSRVRTEAFRDRVREKMRERVIRPVARRMGQLGTRLNGWWTGEDLDVAHGHAPVSSNSAPHGEAILLERVQKPVLMPGEGEAGSNSPVVLVDDVCMIPGDPIVRIEKAPGNGVRIFTGIDIIAPMDEVWKILTDYENLHKIVPSLVENRVLKRASDGSARIEQVGSADVVPGMKFKAKMTLDVNLYLENNPIPDHQIANYIHDDKMSSPEARDIGEKTGLRRGVFPRPYALTSLPHRDITMKDVKGAPGDFEHYQGVWRVQPLPGCAVPDGQDAARLTYAVEIQPKGLLPVRLIEKRIAADLKINLMAIREAAEEKVAADGTLAPAA